MATWRSVLLLAFAVAVGASAQDTQIAWQPDHDAALKQAQTDKKPVLIVLLMDNESANDEVATGHLHTPEIVALSKSFVCLIANGSSHAETVGKDPTGAETVCCSKFGVITCAHHQRLEAKIRADFMDDAARVAAPQFLILAPDGKTVLLHHVYTLSVQELASKLRIALGLQDPSKETEVVKQMRAVTDEVLKQANSNNVNKRQEGLKALATSDDPRVVDFLIKQTAETVDDARRIEAVEAMGQRGNGRVLPVLHKLLGSGSFQVKLAVARALESLGMPDSAPALLGAIKRENKAQIRSLLIRALVTCDPVTPAHRKVLIGMIKSNAQTDKLSALRACARLQTDDELTKALLASATDSNSAVRGVAYWALGAHKVQEAVPLITKALAAEKNEHVRTIGQSTVAKITGATYAGPDADSAMSSLCSMAGLSY